MTNELLTVAEESTRNVFFLFSGAALSTIISAISAILIARLLGPELYGQYGLAFVVPQLLFLFTDLGLSQGIIKFTAGLRQKGPTNHLIKLVKNVLLVKASVGIIIFIINYAFAYQIASIILQRPDLTFYVQIASISILFQVMFTTVASVFTGLDKTEYNALTANLQAIAKTIISVTLVIMGLSVIGAIIGQVASQMIAAAASASIFFLMMREKHNTKNNQNIAEDLRKLLRYGAPLYASLLISGFVPLYQNVMLAIFTTDADIGNYRAATNFMTLVGILSVPIVTALLTAFSKLETSSTEKIKMFFKYSNKYTALIITPITILIILFSNEMVQIVYGTTYQSAPSFLVTYSLVYFLVGIGAVTLASFYNGLGETKTTLKMSLIGFFIIIALSPILTKTYAVTGLIIAILIASTAATAYGSYNAIRNHKIGFDRKSLAKIYLASITSAIIPLIILQISPMPKLLNFTIGATMYVFTYITLIPIAKIINRAELETVRQILQKIKLLKTTIQPIIRYQEKILDWKVKTHEDT